MSSDRPRAGRPRRASTDEAILGAALELLREQGPESVNVAAIAARAGVARTTIYRRYRDREELLARALRQVTERGGPPEEAPVGDKLRWVLDRTEEVLDAGIGMGGVASVLAGSDAELAAAMRRALDDGLRPVRDQVAADIRAGRLPAELDADSLLATALGAFLAQVLLHGSPAGERWKDGLVELLRVPVGTDDDSRVERHGR